jgi:copper(I)-binding protein
MTLRQLTLLAAISLCTSAAQAHEFKLGAIGIGHPYARPTVAGQPAGGAYLKLDNKGTADRLLGGSTAAAARVELHTMNMDGDVMRMRQVDAIDVPVGQVVELKPGGLHIMLMGLKQPLKVGERLPLTLKFEKAGEVKVEVLVENPKAGDAPAGHSH